MTICISAIGKNEINGEEFIVFATDHMVTFGQEQIIQKDLKSLNAFMESKEVVEQNV